MWRNDIKCKYMFMFSLKNLAHKGLSLFLMVQLKINQIGSGNGLAPNTHKPLCEPVMTLSFDLHMPSHYLSNKLQWNSNQNTPISFQENAFQNISCTLSAILFRPQYVRVCVINQSKLIIAMMIVITHKGFTVVPISDKDNINNKIPTHKVPSHYDMLNVL